MAEYKNIVGTPPLDYVQDQINKRSELVNKKTRSSTDLQFLTNRNCFIRLSSGAIINQKPSPIKYIFEPPINGQGLRVEGPSNRITDTSELDEGFIDTIAKNNVLQGGTVSVDGDKTILKKGFDQTYTQGVTDQLGLKPMPGITNVSVGTGGKWQTLMQADIEFICYDLDQLDLMSKLYMSLGVTVLLEWGHIPYLDNNGQLQTNIRPLDFFSPNFNTKETLVKEITRKREATNGNYDGILGTVHNFSWTANNDGSYNCKTQIMGPGGMVESLRINTSNNIDFDDEEGDESEKYSSVLENALFSIKKFITLNTRDLVTEKIADIGLSGAGTKSTFTTRSFKKISLQNTSDFSNQSYGEFLSTIYNQATYQGPIFKKDTVEYDKNEFSKFGNAWQKIANLPDSTPSISPDLYSGYLGYFKSFENGEALSNPYITFGHLICLIQHLAIFTEGDSISLGSSSSNKNLKSVVYLDYNPENTIISTGALEASIDPTTCIIPWSIKDSIVNGKKAKKLSPFFSPLNVSSYEKPPWYNSSKQEGNIYKNFNSNVGKSKNAINEVIGEESFNGKLFDILINIDFVLKKLKNLSSGNEDRSVNLIEFINSILDGINLSLGKSNNFRAFSDPTYPVIRVIDENVVEQPDSKNILTIPTYGTKSIVYDYSFSSKITPKLATQIVIATQGLQNGGIKSFPEDVLSYQKLNNDVRDRFSKVKVSAVTSTNLSTQQTEEKKYLKSLQKLYDHIYNVYANDANKSLSSSTISNLTPLYSDLQNKQKKLSKSTPPSNILLPIEYSITLDGISGVLPYNIFKVPDDRLPKKYKGRVAFAVFSINHDFSNNQWTTTLKGQTVMLDQTPIFDDRNIPETPEELTPNKTIPEQQQNSLNTTYPGVVNTTAFELTPPIPQSAIGTPSDLTQQSSTNISPLTGQINPDLPTNVTDLNINAIENEVPIILNFIRTQEGFETGSYNDKGSLRIGYGSDTITRTNGTIESVTQYSIVNEAEANLDLQRRVIQEFIPKVQARCRELGVNYNQLPTKVKVVFVDCAYNYGSLWYDIIRSYINGGVNGLIDELQRRANLGAGQVPSRRTAEINYLKGI